MGAFLGCTPLHGSQTSVPPLTYGAERQRLPTLLQPLSSREAVLDTLKISNKDHVRWALGQLSAEEPELFRDVGVVTNGRRRRSYFDHWRGRGNVDCFGRSTASSCPADPLEVSSIKLHCPEEGLHDGATIQFSSKLYFCNEAHRSVVLSVLRTGDSSSRAEVSFSTKDGTAKAGLNYKAQRGKLIFQPGEHVKDIEVMIVENQQWDQVRSFQVELSQEGLVGASLGLDLWRAMVFEIDETTYPTERCKELLGSAEHGEFSKFRFLLEYMRFIWKDQVLWRRTIKHALVDQLKNFNLLFQLLLTVVLVDFVLSRPEGKETRVRYPGHWLAVIAVSMVLPTAGLHALDMMRVTYWRVGGPVLLDIQSALLRQFFHLAAEVRSEVRLGEFIETMTAESLQVVQDGVTQVLVWPKYVGRLLVPPIFIGVSAVLDEQEYSGIALLLTLVFPAVISLALLCCGKRVERTMERQSDMIARVYGKVEEMASKYALILDFYRRGVYQKQFEAHVATYNDATVTVAQVRLSQRYMLKWLKVISVAAYTLVGGASVISGKVPLGLFLANLNLIRMMGDCWQDISDACFRVQGMLPSLVQIIQIMNMPTDYTLAAASAAYCQKETLRIVRHQGDIDRIPINVQGLSDCFDVRTGKGAPSGQLASSVNLSGVLEISQGELVCVTGQHGTGKMTLLKMLGGLHWRDHRCADKIFIPSHIRSLFVRHLPQFLMGTLRDNLTLGVDGQEDKSDERVDKICTRIGFNTRLMEALRSQDVLDWEEVLSRVECQLVSIARALIANMEFLVIDRPLELLTSQHSAKVLVLLQEFVSQRGVQQDAGTRHLRRPRTCLICSNNPACHAICHRIYEVTEKGLRQIR